MFLHHRILRKKKNRRATRCKKTQKKLNLGRFKTENLGSKLLFMGISKKSGNFSYSFSRSPKA